MIYMTDNLIQYDLQKVHKVLTETKGEHTVSLLIASEQKDLTLANL